MQTLDMIQRSDADLTYPMTAERIAPGLALAPATYFDYGLARDDNGAMVYRRTRIIFGGTWCAIHVPSGLQIHQFDTIEQARHFADTLASWDDIDWTADQRTIQAHVDADPARFKGAYVASLAYEPDEDD